MDSLQQCEACSNGSAVRVNRSLGFRFGAWAIVAFLAFFVCQTEAQLPIPRGRPHLNAARTTFVGDNGQDLRGPFTSTEWTGPVPASQIASMKNLGFNAVHLYAE